MKTSPWGFTRPGTVFLVVVFLLAACAGQIISPSKTVHAKGVYHRVKTGETLYHIARAYHVDIQSLAEANNIEDPDRIKADSVVFIPEAAEVIDDIMTSVKPAEHATEAPPGKTAPVKKNAPVKGVSLQQINQPDAFMAKEKKAPPKNPDIPIGHSTIHMQPLKVQDQLPKALLNTQRSIVTQAGREMPARAVEKSKEMSQQPPVAREPVVAAQPVESNEAKRNGDPSVKSGKPKEDAELLQFDRKRFVWPVKGRIVSRFGIQQNGMYNNGITIVAREGMPVAASAGGTVIFSGSLKDYGETIILKHADHYATVYTRLGQRTVKLDEHVKQNEAIGFLAKSDEKGGGARMAFEIRYRNKARNPMFFLPQ